MSHSTVIVIGEDPEAMLTPFDENLDVEPYRKYEEGEKPTDHWLYKVLTEEHGLAEDCDWPAFVEAHNARYKEDAAVLYDPEQDRVYSMSTYNPQSRWDWYLLGGRWTGFFSLKDGALGTTGEPGVMTPPATRGRADQARKADIDWDGMRERHSASARKEHRQAMAIIAGLPPIVSWSAVREDFPDDISAARRAYGAQAGVEALRRGGVWFDDPVVDLCLRAADPEAAYVAHTVARRTLPFAVLNADGWHERGRMGWFGVVHDESDDWSTRAQALIDAAPDDALLSLYDVHI